MDSKSSFDPHGPEFRLPEHNPNFKTVSLAEVLPDEGGFRITSRTDIRDLIDSIAKIGLIHPPVLVRNSSGYKIVCGFRRVAACRDLGWSGITARILKKTTDRFHMALLAIADNALQRSLNLVEASRALNLLAEVCADQKCFRQTALALGLPVNPAVAAKVKRICRLPLRIQEGILSGAVGLSMALALGELEQGAGEALLGLFDELKLGLNRQRELLLLLEEIARREGRPTEQLITEKPLQDILTHPRLDRAVKRQKIRSYLQQRRFPSVSKAAADYQKRVKQLKLGNRIGLTPPANFEDATFTMTLRFNNRQDLSDLKKKIEKILEHPAFAEILDR